MKKPETNLTFTCALLAVILGSSLQAQSPATGKLKFSSPLAQQPRHHRFAQKAWHNMMTPPDLLKTLKQNWFSSFQHPETYFFKNTLPQKHLAAEHTLSGEVKMAWANQYGSQLLPSDDAATDIAVDRNGNVYVTGYLTNQPFGTDYFTAKYNAAGRKLWEARYNGENDGDDFAAAIAVDGDGNVYVTGGSKTAANASNYVTIKYNAAGSTQWTARYDLQNGANKSYDVATAMAIDESGNVYVSGWSENDIATVKYNSAGAEQWNARHPGRGNTEVNAIAVDQSGNVYMAGQSNSVFITVKYNSAGQQEWSGGYSEFAGSQGIATALAVDRRGGVYVTGMHEGLSYPQYLTIKFNREGAREWTAFYRGPEPCNWNIATALALDDSGRVYVTGESGWFYEDCSNGPCVTREDIDYATIKYNRAGELQWGARYGPAEDCSHAAAVKVDRAGNVLVTGYDRQDFATLKYDRDGRQQWIASFNGADEADDAAVASAIDETGKVYVTGWSMRNQDKDFATVKYDNAGVAQWVARENGPGNSFDRATALALDEGGNVYVAGTSENLPGTSSVWTMINYHAAGAASWERHGQSAGNFRNTAEKIAVDAGGNIYVISSRYDLSRLYHRYGMLAKYNREGMELWSTAFDSTDHEGYSLPTALGVDRFGNIYVTGASNNADFVTTKYDVDGKVLWQARENPGLQSFNGATAMAIDDSGNVYVAGISDGDGVTIKYNAAGIKQWMARYHAAAAIHRVVGIVVEPARAGENIYVLADLGFYADYLTLKYNRAGARQWEARYSRPGNSFDQPAALTIDARENVYVTGEAGTIKYDRDGTTIWTVDAGATALTVDEAGNLYTAGVYSDSTRAHDAADFFTVKYNTFGSLEWSARYDGPGNSLDYPVAIALDKSRNVYVTGQSRSDESQHWSYVTTIKYSQTAPAVNDKKNDAATKFHLAQNFPNPFNPTTRIRYTLAQSGRVTLKIFDVLGREIATLVNAVKPAGEYDVQWSPENLSGGVYIYRLQAGDPSTGSGHPSASSGHSFVESKKLVYMP